MSRSRVCLDCRTVSRGEQCAAGPGHRVVDLASEQRSKLVDEVWGPPSWRRERRKLARAGAGGAAAGGLGEAFTACGGCDGCEAVSIGGDLGAVIGALLVILAVALAAVAIVWLIGKLVAYIRAKRNEPKPNGALLPPVRHPSRRTRRGVVVARRELASPLSGRPCVGWALELASKRHLGSSVMLRDGESYGFDVELDDGSRVRVAPGALLLARDGRELDELPQLEGYLRTVDPGYVPGDEEAAIPFDRVAAVELRDRDSVDLVGNVHHAPDPEAPEHYRGAAAMVLVPNELIAIRRR